MSKRATALVMADDPDLKAHMAEIKREGNQRLLELLLTRKEEITHPDPEFAAAFVIDQLSAMFYARTDPYQKASALAECSDDAAAAPVKSVQDWCDVAPSPSSKHNDRVPRGDEGEEELHVRSLADEVVVHGVVL